MNLLEVRTNFVKQSGRYDLVIDATSFANNGADYYIQAAQRMLDRFTEFPKDEGEMTITLATSAISTTLSNVMSIREVAVVDDQDDTIKYLVRKSLRELRENYGDTVSALSDVTAAEPIAWALGWLRTNVTGTTTTEGGTKKLVTMPPADRTYTLRLRGLFGSNTLSNDTSVSFWSIEHPDLLIWGSMYHLEVTYRNFEGSRAILANIRELLKGIDDEIVEQGQVEQSQLRDTFGLIKPPLSGGSGRHT